MKTTTRTIALAGTAVRLSPARETRVRPGWNRRATAVARARRGLRIDRHRVRSAKVVRLRFSSAARRVRSSPASGMPRSV